MKRLLTAAAIGLLAACSNPSGGSVERQEEGLEEKLLADYLERINSNNIDTLMAGLTDDVVYQAPHAPEVVGKDAVREWVSGYFDAYDTSWEKRSLSFVQSGDWAIERYAYHSTDVDRATGDSYEDEGKGINVYQRGTDGQWRVALDGWSTDLPVASPAPAGDAKTVAAAVYAAVAAGDVAAFADLMSPGIVWNEAESNPYADKNPYIGPDAVLSGLFARFAEEWDESSVIPQDYVTEGDRVIVFGRYRETYKATGKRHDIPFVHDWTIKDGKITAFQQYTDTETLVSTMTE